MKDKNQVGTHETNLDFIRALAVLMASDAWPKALSRQKPTRSTMRRLR